MEPALNPLLGLSIANPDTLYIEAAKMAEEERRGLPPSFSNGNSDPQWMMRCNRKGLTRWRGLLRAMLLRCSRGQCCTAAEHDRQSREAVAAKITSVSLTPLISFNPSELMSIFAGPPDPPPHPPPPGAGL